MSRKQSGAILIVEDEADIRDLVRHHVEREGFRALVAADADEAIEIARRERPVLVVLDLMLPGGDGYDVCRALRAEPRAPGIPIIMLTARASEVDRVLGLELGADDYVTKPFSPRELMARIRAVLRRGRSAAPSRSAEVYEKGRLRVDLSGRRVWVEDREVHLTRREFDLLRFLLSHPGRVYSRDRILDLVWGEDTYVEPRTVDVHVRRLRSLVERNPAEPELIETVRGVGYRFREPEDDA